MKKLLFALLLTTLYSCAEDHSPSPCYIPSWEGDWRRMNLIGPDWEYSFDGAIMHQTLTKFGATLAHLEFPYSTRNDTLWIGGNLTNAPRRWKYEFIGDSVVEVIDIPPDGVLNERFWMRKQPGH